MWPFTTSMQSVWLALYLVTFALHALFIGYVVTGTGYALVQAVRGADDPLAARVRDRLPFMLGAGITAGVAPLLFLQLLYQERFYTANLLAGPRWGAVVPALIAGFYALYVTKAAATLRWRRAALAVALVCFLFVAWSWTEMHLLMRDDAAWREMYAAGERFHGDAGVAPRLLLWLGAMPVLFAVLALWSASAAERRRIAVLALGGFAVCAAAAAWLASGEGAIAPGARGWLLVAIAGAVLAAAGWVRLARVPHGGAASLVTGATTAALLAGVVVRESPRIALLEPPRASVAGAQGFPLFAVTLVVGVAAIVWIWRTIKQAS